MKKLVTFFIATLVLFGCTQNSKEPGSSATGSSSTTQATPAPQMPAAQSTMRSRAIEPIPADILNIYSGVVIDILDRRANAVIPVEVPFNQPVSVENTPFTLEVTQFFPDFTMSDAGYSTKSMEPNNAAVRIKITGVSPEFEGILFKEFPDVHPYENPDYGILLAGVIKGK